VLRSGRVIVGSLPTSDGTSTMAQAGCLLVLNNTGNVVETFYGSPINVPWDMTALDGGNWPALFVTNVLNGTVAANGSVVNQGSVVRIEIGISEGHAMDRIDDRGRIGLRRTHRSRSPRDWATGVGLRRDCDKSDPDDCTGNGDSRHPEPVLRVADTLNNRIEVIPTAVTRTNSAEWEPRSPKVAV
jgi:hypothetical protein